VGDLYLVFVLFLPIGGCIYWLLIGLESYWGPQVKWMRGYEVDINKGYLGCEVVLYFQVDTESYFGLCVPFLWAKITRHLDNVK